MTALTKEFSLFDPEILKERISFVSRDCAGDFPLAFCTMKASLVSHETNHLFASLPLYLISTWWP